MRDAPWVTLGLVVAPGVADELGPGDLPRTMDATVAHGEEPTP
jgi:hypothetical protein